MPGSAGPAEAPDSMRARNCVNRAPIAREMRITPCVLSHPGKADDTKLSGQIKAWLRCTLLRVEPNTFMHRLPPGDEGIVPSLPGPSARRRAERLHRDDDSRHP